MKKLKKAVLLLLALCQLVVCFTACDRTTETEETTSDGPFAVTAENLSSYTIILPSQASKPLESVASFLKSIISQKHGVNLEIKKDSEAETEYEILIGLTNRAESIEFCASLNESD